MKAVSDGVTTICRKRLGIFYFSNTDGVVDDYVEYLIDNMRDYLSEIYIVVGGCLTCEARKKLSAFTDIILTERTLTSRWAGYQLAVQCFGQPLLGKYDEIVFFDNRLIGPLYPLEEMFSTMEKKKLDYWFLVADNGSRLPDIIVCCGKLVNSYEFYQYWMDEHEEKDWNSYFGEKGFRYAAYIESPDLLELNERPIIFYPKELVAEYGCPFVSIESFELPYQILIDESAGQASYELFDYLKYKKLYDVDMLWSYFLRCFHQADIVKNLHLNYILSGDADNEGDISEILKSRKVAMLIHIYRTDMADVLAGYASFMPPQADILITTDTEEKANEIRLRFEKRKLERIIIRVIKNRGRDVSSKLVGVKDLIMDYDYVCCIHDKKTPHLKPQSIGEGFGYKCFCNIASSAAYVRNVIRLFETNQRLGIAVPPEPNHATFFTTLGLEWVGNYQTAKSLAEKLDLKVPMDEYKEPVAPFGSFFWVRPKALKKLYDQNWEYTDFPEEPIKDDATILHAIERIYPFVVQDAGYYPAIIMSEKYARIEFTNLRYYVRGYNRTLIKHGIINRFSEMQSEIENVLDSEEEKRAVIQLYEARIKELEGRLDS